MAQDSLRPGVDATPPRDVRDRIASAWDHLSEGERRIAARLAETTGEVAYASATQLGRELGLSDFLGLIAAIPQPESLMHIVGRCAAIKGYR